MNLDNIEAGFNEEQLNSIMDVFTTEGWRLIQHDMKLYKKQMDTTENVQTESELWKLKGELKGLDWFINLKEWYQAAEAYEKDL